MCCGWWAKPAGTVAGPPDAAVFLNRATKGTRFLSEVHEVIGQLAGIRVLKQIFTQRQILTDCYSQATTVFENGTGPALEAAEEYGRLFAELLKACPTDPLKA